MIGDSESKDTPYTFTDDERAWIGEHLKELRKSVAGQQILQWSLLIAFVVGLAAHIAGYELRSSVTTQPLGLIADLLYALGWALWTGVVMFMFVQIIPEAKRRQIERFLDAYEAVLRNKNGAESNQASENVGKPKAS